MSKMLHPQDVLVMREALELLAAPLEDETIALMLSDGISNPLAEEQKQAEQILAKVCKFIDHPESNLELSPEEKNFTLHALRNLIFVHREVVRTEKRPKLRRSCEQAIRQATVCISRLA